MYFLFLGWMFWNMNPKPKCCHIPREPDPVPLLPREPMSLLEKVCWWISGSVVVSTAFALWAASAGLQLVDRIMAGALFFACVGGVLTFMVWAGYAIWQDIHRPQPDPIVPEPKPVSLQALEPM